MNRKNKLMDSSGIAGLFKVDHAASDCALLLHGLQHRGQDGAGIAVSDGQSLSCFRCRGLLAELLKKEPVVQTAGSAAIGQVRMRCPQDRMDENLQPIMVRAHQGHFAVVCSGMVSNGDALRLKLEAQGLIFQGTSDAELIAHLIQLAQGHLFEKIVASCQQMEGAYSFLLMTKSTMYALRSSDGARPLFMGRVQDGWAFSSETGDMQILEAENIQELKPGELVRLGKGSEQHWQLDQPVSGPCAMEYVYFSRPDSVIASAGVHGMRQKFGKELARGETETADMVIGVPDTAMDAAAAFARELGIPYEIGLIKNRYIGSTFIRPTSIQRQQGMRVRLNAISSIVKDKDVFLVDDSIVRGSTARRLCQLLKEAGARKVHFRIAAPVICEECHKGAESSLREELAGAVYSPEELRQLINADSIRFLELDQFEMCLGRPVCTACFRKGENNG